MFDRSVEERGFPGPAARGHGSSHGPVVVYRDRAAATEIRDIYVTRRVEGAWTKPRPVHADNWVMRGCPVNGPAIAAQDNRVVVAWYTGAAGKSAVKVASSRDGGAEFSAPLRIDGGAPFGRVDVVLSAAGDSLVSWMEKAGTRAEIRVARITRAGKLTGTWSVATIDGSRSSGIPQLARAGDTLLLCWTDAKTRKVRLARITEPELGVGPSRD